MKHYLFVAVFALFSVCVHNVAASPNRENIGTEGLCTRKVQQVFSSSKRALVFVRWGAKAITEVKDPKVANALDRLDNVEREAVLSLRPQNDLMPGNDGLMVIRKGKDELGEGYFISANSLLGLKHRLNQAKADFYSAIVLNGMWKETSAVVAKRTELEKNMQMFNDLDRQLIGLQETQNELNHLVNKRHSDEYKTKVDFYEEIMNLIYSGEAGEVYVNKAKNYLYSQTTGSTERLTYLREVESVVKDSWLYEVVVEDMATGKKYNIDLSELVKDLEKLGVPTHEFQNFKNERGHFYTRKDPSFSEEKLEELNALIADSLGNIPLLYAGSLEALSLSEKKLGINKQLIVQTIDSMNALKADKARQVSDLERVVVEAYDEAIGSRSVMDLDLEGIVGSTKRETLWHMRETIVALETQIANRTERPSAAEQGIQALE